MAISLGGATPAQLSNADQSAEEILEITGVQGGLIVHLGCGDGRWTADLRRNERFIVHGLDRDPAKVAAARRHIRSLGIYGPVSVDRLQGKNLPYTDNLVNLLVSKDVGMVPLEEILRVLVPQGIAYIQEGARWIKTVKPRPETIDEWTHNCHGPDGNPVANDSIVGPPKHYQWVSEPLWGRAHDTDSSLNAVVTGGGRIFYLVDEAPAGLPGQHDLPDKWFLVARDAFNGILLWKIPVGDWGWRAWKKTWFLRRPGNMPLNVHRRVIAVGDRVYATLGYRAPVSQIDAATGTIIQKYQETEGANEILLHGNTLFLSRNRGDDVEILAMRSDTGQALWRTAEAYRGTTQDVVMWPPKWKEDQIPKLDAVPNLATDGRIVCFLDGSDIACLDAKSGGKLWRTTVPEKSGLLWVGTLIIQDGVVLHATPQSLVALSAGTGEQIWSQPKKELGWLWYQWKDVFVVKNLVWTWSAELSLKEYANNRKKKAAKSRWPTFVNGYDLKTGELKKQVPLGHIFTAHHHHRCYRNKATLRYILASRRGTEFVDLEEGQHTVHNWIRGTCHLGMMPANGLLYAPPHPCRCYINEKLTGFVALAPGGREPPGGSGREGIPRLEKGPAFGKWNSGDSDPSGKEDWPTFRRDAIRSGSANTPVPAELKPAWQVQLGGPLSSPVVAAGKVFLSSVDAHTVLAVDARDGRKLWEFTAGGRVDSPPTYHAGTVLFGCADGWVYCLRAAGGILAWRFRAAPGERLVGAFGQIESAWPVPGSLLVQKGIAYFTAGRSSYLDGGIYLYGVDAATGEKKFETLLEGPETDFGNDEAHFAYGNGPGALPDILQGDGQRIYLRNLAFNASLQRLDGKETRVRALGGFLDDTYFRRAFWYFDRTANYGRIIVHDGDDLFIVRMFRSMKLLTPDNYFTPGKDRYLLLAQGASQESHIQVANSNSLNPTGMPLTVEAWIRAASPDGVILARGGAASGYALILKGGKPRFLIRVGKTVHEVDARENVAGRWIHLAGVLTGEKKLQIYVDGVLSASAEAPSLIAAPPGQPTEIGADLGNGAGDYESPFSFSGIIDEVRLYHRALRAEEIRKHVERPHQVPRKAENLVLCFSFDQGNAIDESGNGNHGIVEGAEPVDGRVGKALRFFGRTAGWSADLPIRVRAMIAAPDLLFIAGPPDVLDPDDPLGAFEGRKGGLLWVFDKKSGEKLAEYHLDSPPVFNGMAAASRRLYIANRDGTLCCMEGKD